jgi:hypothetical protein
MGWGLGARAALSDDEKGRDRETTGLLSSTRAMNQLGEMPHAQHPG